jgi:hypothetical protein
MRVSLRHTWVLPGHTVENGYTLNSVPPRGIKLWKTSLLFPIVVIIVRSLLSGSPRL